MRIISINSPHKSQTQIMQSSVHKQFSISNPKKTKRLTGLEIRSILDSVYKSHDRIYSSPCERFELLTIALITKYISINRDPKLQKQFIETGDYEKLGILNSLIGQEYELFEGFYVAIKMPRLNDELNGVWKKMSEIQTDYEKQLHRRFIHFMKNFTLSQILRSLQFMINEQY